MKTIISIIFVCLIARGNCVFSDSQKEEILTLHNTIRSEIANGKAPGKDGSSQPPAANMLAMVWNDDLAATAQTWANKCDGEPHDSQEERKGNSGFTAVGQNMMPCHPSQSDCIKRGMTAFYDESSGYSYNNEDCSGHPMCTHYTQLAWAMSRFVGCGYSQCAGHSSQRLVCNYGPAGNFVGEKPYITGPACSKCLPGVSFCLRGNCLSKKDCDNSPKSGECRCTVNAANCQSNGGTYSASECLCTCPSGKAGVNCELECKDSQSPEACNYYQSNRFCEPSSVYYSYMKGMCGYTCKLCDAIPKGEENEKIKVNYKDKFSK